jgi:hypothetical protein
VSAGAPATGDPRIYPRPIRHGGSTWLPLTRNPGLNVFKQIISPGTHPRRHPDQHTHEGNKCLYVTSSRTPAPRGSGTLTPGRETAR